ncbi:MAG: winged helix-turn-helix transcriptional regulator [Promethearchaeota archaeon]|nr:MAG: winged helix-turn-helix transcriptional regulator [Candidatus Lokiarchaeota archaeon]
MDKSKIYKEPFFELLESEIRFRIFSLLNIYPELSFSEIAEQLNKSKSTLHPHIQKLMDIGVVELSRDEKVRGNFTRNYYSLKSGVFNDLKVADKDSSLIDNYAFIVIKNWVKFIIKTMKLYEKFLNRLELDESGLDILKKNILNHETLSGMFFFSPKQYREASDLTIKYLKDLERIQSEGIKEEKPFYLLSITLPIKDMLEDSE